MENDFISYAAMQFQSAKFSFNLQIQIGGLSAA